MFKQISISLLLLAFITQVFKGPFIVMEYYTNTAAFEMQCVNKTRPLMKCNGKCQMMKQLQQQQNNEQQHTAIRLQLKIELLPPVPHFSFTPPFKIIAANNFSLVTDRFYYDISYKITHPPQV